MEFDDALREHIGQFGRYQIGIMLFISIENMFIIFHILSPVFLVGRPDHHCKIPALNLSNCSQQDVLHYAIPLNKDGKVSSCEMYDRNYSLVTEDEVCPHASTLANISTVSQHLVPTVSCNSWEYDNSTFLKTMVTEWNLVCEDEYKASSVAAVYMAGWITGLIIFGFISDLVGRKPVVLGTGLVYVLAGMSVGLVPNLPTALAMRFLQAFCGAGKTTATFVILTEMVGPDWRTFVMVCYWLYWAFGYGLMAGLAYIIQDWRHLELVLSTPEILYFLIFIFLVPESPRWLLSKNRYGKAHAILQHMARRNNREWPNDLHISNSKEKIGTVVDLVRTPGLRKATFILILGWYAIGLLLTTYIPGLENAAINVHSSYSCILFANGFVYFGLSLNSSNLGGSPYLNFLISGALELPAYLLLIPLLKNYGRVSSYSVLMFTTGALLLCVTAIPTGMVWPVVTLSMLGKFCIADSFLVIWFYTVELYPTVIRSIGLNYIGSISRVSALLAAYVAILGDIHPSLPEVTFGVIALASGFSSLALPETKGAHLSQTVDQAEDFIQNSKCVSCFKCVRSPSSAPVDEKELEALKDDANNVVDDRNLSTNA